MRSTEQSTHVLERVDRVALTRDRLRLETEYDKDTTDTMTAALVGLVSAVVVCGIVVAVGVVVRAIVVVKGWGVADVTCV
jgi:hypothetical protein